MNIDGIHLDVGKENIVKVNIPVYIISTILESVDQCSHSPGIYIFKYYDRIIRCGYSKDIYVRVHQYDDLIEYRYKDIDDKIPYTHILQLEVQSEKIANGVEMFVHHYFPSLLCHANNKFHLLDLEEEWKNKGRGKELELHEMLGYSSLPLLEDLLKKENKMEE